MTTLAFASLSRDSRNICRVPMVGPLIVWLWLSHAQFVMAMFAAVLEFKIWLSHCRDRVTFWLQGLITHTRANKALYTDRRLFFSLLYFCFCTSFSYLSVFHLLMNLSHLGLQECSHVTRGNISGTTQNFK